jgi:hypothetical protein
MGSGLVPCVSPRKIGPRSVSGLTDIEYFFVLPSSQGQATIFFFPPPDRAMSFSCKGRSVCPSCNTRRMAETAAHLVDHVFPPLPVRQWVLSLPKRLRYFLRHDRRTVTAVLTIFLRVVEQVLREQAPGAAPKTRW